MKHPIICIPRISKTFSVTDIRYIFNDYEFGNIRNINIVSGRETNKVFIIYSYWNTKCNTKIFRNALNNNQEMKLFYDFPNFWKCYKSFT